MRFKLDHRSSRRHLRPESGDNPMDFDGTMKLGVSQFSLRFDC